MLIVILPGLKSPAEQSYLAPPNKSSCTRHSQLASEQEKAGLPLSLSHTHKTDAKTTFSFDSTGIAFLENLFHIEGYWFKRLTTWGLLSTYLFSSKLL